MCEDIGERLKEVWVAVRSGLLEESLGCFQLIFVCEKESLKMIHKHRKKIFNRNFTAMFNVCVCACMLETSGV